MSFINARLPHRLAAGLRIGPEWNTQVVQLDNGREQRNRQWLYPKWRGSGSTAAYTPPDQAAFRAWFVAVAGKHKAFRVTDPLDHTAANEALAPNLGTLDPVQLVKTYAIDGGGAGVTVLVQAPWTQGFALAADGLPVAGTLDDETGLFTPDAPWAGTAFTWTGRFDRWMRFDSDWGALTAEAPNVYTADIELVEVRR